MNKESFISQYGAAYKDGIGVGISVVGIIGTTIWREVTQEENAQNEGVGRHIGRKLVHNTTWSLRKKKIRH